jgi:flagellar hook-length control protein FliK
MATALGHSAASAATPAAPATPAHDSGTTSAAAPAQTAVPAAPDNAIAWIAQVLMPTATPALAPASEPSAADADSAGGPLAANAAGAGQSASAALNASLARFNAAALAQAPTTQANDTQMAAANLAAATTSGDITTLADLQKLISGMTGANAPGTDNDSEADAATPTTHTAATSDSSEATQAAAALQAAALTRSGSGVGSATLTIQAPVGSAAFADEVGARVAGLGQAGITQAQLQMNPADLGPVQVHITLQAGQASVWFGATHADTRAALEQSLPRLRELFAGAGMPLSDSGVFREPPQQQPAQSLPTSSSTGIPGSDSVIAPTVTQVANIRLALLDTYA